MKYKNSVRPLIVLTILVLMSFKSFSQTSDSCTCVPNDKLRVAAKKIEQGKFDLQELELTRQNIKLLEARIADKDKIIDEYKGKDSTNKNIVATYEAEKQNLVDQKNTLVKEVKKLEKALKRQIGKTVFAGLAGIAMSVILILSK